MRNPARLTARTLAALLLIALVSMALTACGDADTEDAGPSVAAQVEQTRVSSDLQRLPAQPDLPGLNDQVRGNTAFATDLYGHLGATGGNLVYSPHSISIALSMVYAGAESDTAGIMRDTLHLGELDPTLEAFNTLDQLLASRGEGLDTGDAQPFRLSVSNAVWAQAGFPFRDAYLDRLALYFGAGIYTQDFTTDPEGATDTINAWVSEKTEAKIPNLIPAGAISPATRMVLTNAVYFKADWASPFERDATFAAPFTRADATQADVDTMHQESTFPYAQGDGFQALEMPYVGGELTMLLVLPSAGSHDTIEASLSPELIDGIVAQLSPTRTQVALPKFDFKTATPLKATLTDMGMGDAFDGGLADFTGMFDPTATNENLYISDVIHEATITVDEEGTEAAAATAVIMNGTTSAPIEPAVVFQADRPFLFFVRDVQTGAILFGGRVADPS